MPGLKIAVLVSGNGSNLQALIDAIDQESIKGEIVVVISDRKNAYALERAKKRGIDTAIILKECAETKADAETKLMLELNSRNVNLVILAGFLSILPETITKQYEGKIINIHPSLIPAFCGKGFYGAWVHKAVIESGIRVSGATVHFVDEGTDTGPIILQQEVAVAEDETAETLATKVLEIEHKLIVKAVKLFCDGRLLLGDGKVSIL